MEEKGECRRKEKNVREWRRREDKGGKCWRTEARVRKGIREEQ
jgi:hypothetical protein